jgi:hypothetical protein
MTGAVTCRRDAHGAFVAKKLTAQSFTIAADSLGFAWQLWRLIVKPTLDFIGTSREF